MIKADDVKTRIISVLQRRGPSLPIQIAKDISMSSLFVSAFLSELTDEGKIKVSTLKVGGSPLYYLEGQETSLENFQKYMHPKEGEAFQLLKNNKILKDSSQEPAIRVALRQIKDFAFLFKKDDELYWRYLAVTEKEVKDILEPEIKAKNIALETVPEIKNEILHIERTINKEDMVSSKKNQELVKEIAENIKKIEPEKQLKLEEKLGFEQEKPKKTIKKELKSDKPSFENQKNFNNPLAIKPEPKVEKIKPKSEFVIKTIEFLEKSGSRIIEEKEYSKRDYLCISELNTDLGPIAFLTLSKDKKLVSEQDLDLLLRQAQSIPLPALFLSPGELNKKAKEYQKNYYSIIKYKKIT